MRPKSLIFCIKNFYNNIRCIKNVRQIIDNFETKNYFLWKAKK